LGHQVWLRDVLDIVPEEAALVEGALIDALLFYQLPDERLNRPCDYFSELFVAENSRRNAIHRQDLHSQLGHAACGTFVAQELGHASSVAKAQVLL